MSAIHDEEPTVRRAQDWDPAQPNAFEIAKTRKWLTKRGVHVGLPTPLLSVRIGGRLTQRHTRRYLAYGAVALLAMSAFFFLQYPLGVDSNYVTAGAPLFFVYCAFQLAMWHGRRHRERILAARMPYRTTRIDRPSRLKLLGGWYLASTAITLLGGMALAVAMAATNPAPGAQTYAWSWFILLALGALCTGVVLTGVLNAPTVAESPASLAVDDLLRLHDADEASPIIYIFPLLFDLFGDDHQPSGSTVPIIVYMALSLGTAMIAALVHQRRKLPPGDYGNAETA